MPELCQPGSIPFEKGFKTISEVGKERIRRVLKRFGKGSSAEDLGFRVFKLHRSHFTKWIDYDGEDVEELESLFEKHEIPLVEGWRPEDMIVEIMLQEGFPLDSQVLSFEGHGKNTVSEVSSDICEHRLLVCLDDKVAKATIENLDLQGEDIFICLDSALTDEQKLTLSDRGFLKTI
jgi:adenine-specific DNA-methyltransferase